MDMRSPQKRRSPKTKAELLDEIVSLRARIDALETEATQADGPGQARNAGLERAGDLPAESDEFFRNLIEGSSLGIMILRDFRPVFVNPSFAAVFGYDSPQEVMELGSVMELAAPDDRARVQRIAADRMDGKDSPNRYEYEGWKKNGSSVWLDNHVRIVTWEGEPASLSTVLDITERKQAEEESRRLSGAIRCWSCGTRHVFGNLLASHEKTRRVVEAGTPDAPRMDS
jgi:PAS domain S-box-containing protein